MIDFDRTEADRRLSFDPREADVEREAWQDREAEMAPTFGEFDGPEDEGCPECQRFGGNHLPSCRAVIDPSLEEDDDPPQRCTSCGGRGGWGSINACLDCQGRGWS